MTSNSDRILITHPTEIDSDFSSWNATYKKFGFDVLRLTLEHQDSSDSEDESWTRDRIVLADRKGKELFVIKEDDNRTIAEVMLGLSNPSSVYYAFLYREGFMAGEEHNMDGVNFSFIPGQDLKSITVFESCDCSDHFNDRSPYGLLLEEVEYCKRITQLS